MPQAGRILRLEEPGGAGVRVDSGIYEGFEVTPHYDPILAKIIAYGETREQARRRMVRALSDTVCLGIRTPLEFLRSVVEHEAFVSGATTTDFLDRHFGEAMARGGATTGDVPDLALVAAAIVDLHDRGTPSRPGEAAWEAPSPWRTLGAWHLGG
jgi:geranyl-CoA carboxylase alpha subunit